MPDIEKVIKGLEICRHRVISQENCKECPYIYDGRAKQANCEGVLHWDALAMLKKQIPIAPIKGEHGKCPICGYKADHHYCPNCGQKLNWE